MSHPMPYPARLPVALLLGLVLFLAASAAWADPPTRVARLGYLEREVSFLAAGQADWEQAALNQPLGTGDHLWTDREAGAELQVGGTALRMGERSNLTVLNLDDRIVQLQLTQGSVRLRVRAIGSSQSFEVDTPNLAVSLHRAGDYRIDVDPQGDATTVTVHSGEAEVFGEDASYRVLPNQAYRFYGAGLSDYEVLSVAPPDTLDRWALGREQRMAGTVSARYVSSEVVGLEDLDANGVWRLDESYGYVWTPSQAAVGWTPYRDGHWSWMQPWGWTWVDDAPWGYAVSHYGRWAHIRNAWCWVPGPLREPAVYAPALVVFVGLNSFRASPASGRWFPLAPREVYRPGYQVSQSYFERLNRSNAVIAPSTLSTVYNSKTVIHNTVYINQQVSGAVVLPQRQHVREAPPEARSRPPRDIPAVLARTAPPPSPKAATPTEPVARVQLVPAPAAPLAVPPPVARNEAQRGQRDQRDQRRPEAAPAAPAIAAPARVDAATAEAARAEAAKNDTARANAARAEAARNAAAQAEAANAQAARQGAAQAAEATRKDAAAHADAARANAARENAARADAERNAAAREQASKMEASRKAAAQAEASRNAAAQEQANKANVARPEPARPAPGNAQKPEEPERVRGPKASRKLTPEEEELLRKERGQQH